MNLHTKIIRINSLISGENIARRVASNIAWSVVSEIVGKGILFLVMIYLARSLGVEKFGILSFSQVLASFFWYGVDLGINMYGSGEIAKTRRAAGDLVSILLSLRILSALMMFLLFAGISVVFSTHAAQRTVFLATSLYLVTRALNVDWALRGFEGFKFIAIGNFATFLSMLGLTVIFVNSEQDVVKAALIWSLCYLIGSAVSMLLLVNNFKVEIKWICKYENFVIHLKQSIHFMLSGGLNVLYQYLPMLLVGTLASEYQIGIFSAPYKIVISISYIFSVAPIALYPVFCNLFYTHWDKFCSLYRIYRNVSIVVATIIILFNLLYSHTIIFFLLGPNYEQSVLIFQILAYYLAIGAIRRVYAIVIAATGLQKFYTYVSTIAVIAFMLVYIAFSCFSNVTHELSAGYTLVVTECVAFVVLMFFWRLSHAGTEQRIEVLGRKTN